MASPVLGAVVCSKNDFQYSNVKSVSMYQNSNLESLSIYLLEVFPFCMYVHEEEHLRMARNKSSCKVM